MSAPSNPSSASGIVGWIDSRLPIFSYMDKEYRQYPAPRNFNYFWNFGAIAMVMLVIMIATGIVLSMHYTANVDMASICSVTRMVPISAAMAEEQRPATMSAASTGPSSRTIDTPRICGRNVSALKRREPS